MSSPEEQARRERYLARLAYQHALDDAIAGDPVLRVSLRDRYEPIEQYQKEGPHVGERNVPESEAGRVN